ncbi:MAG: hypothetical protein JXA91_05230, partial [Candidatus Thermoplasmatota archaeon]|nr:hypothetical protein [Candidatus Thermoplasmatota archaeon]
GLGSTYQGANQVFGVSQTVKQYGYMEDETERIVFEGGYPLFILRIVFLIMILSAMKIPIWSKWALFFLFINAMLIFNTYMTFFVATGLIWINNSSSIDNE